MNKIFSTVLITVMLLATINAFAQQEDLLKNVEDSAARKEYITGAFKSTRVINSHSMEMLGKGLLDVRFLHRFGTVENGISNLFGLDEAKMRFGLDYGISKNLTVGIGRSTHKKEWDGFLKYRIVQQSTGPGSFPASLVWVSGIATNTLAYQKGDVKNQFKYRTGYYHVLIIGRKFNNKFSMQLNPTFVHQNLVDSIKNYNNTWAIGTGVRFKVSHRVAIVADYHCIVAGKQPGTVNPLSIGVDIETGGHVFQLHFSNSRGMNERAFITETTNKWSKGEIRFGFNLSRVFTVVRPKI